MKVIGSKYVLIMWLVFINRIYKKNIFYLVIIVILKDLMLGFMKIMMVNGCVVMFILKWIIVKWVNIRLKDIVFY